MVNVIVAGGTVLDGLVVFTIIYGSTDDKNFLNKTIDLRYCCYHECRVVEHMCNKINTSFNGNHTTKSHHGRRLTCI